MSLNRSPVVSAERMTMSVLERRVNEAMQHVVREVQDEVMKRAEADFAKTLRERITGVAVNLSTFFRVEAFEREVRITIHDTTQEKAR